MAEYAKLTGQDIERQYLKVLKENHCKYLKIHGVKMPNLRSKKNFTKEALVLVYLSFGYPDTKVVSKNEVTQFVRKFYPYINDVQQPRHLGAQDGWWIAAGGRDDIIVKLKRGEYKLVTLELPYPGFRKGHRKSEAIDWDEIKKQYKNRCATCGSEDGKPNLHWPGTLTKLQKGHMDPNKPLGAGNIIPQCSQCNRGDRKRWVYDEKGRVIKLAKSSFVLNFDENVQQEIYKILSKKYKEKP